jgi:hypothetical protein
VGKKTLKVGQEEFEGIVKNLLHAKPVEAGRREGRQEEGGEVNSA